MLTDKPFDSQSCLNHTPASMRMMAIVGCAFLFAIGFIAVTQVGSNGHNSPRSNSTVVVQAVGERDVEKEDRPEAARNIESWLLALPVERGGGYFLNQDILELRDEQWKEVKRVPRIRSVEGLEFSEAAWRSFCALHHLESLNNHLTAC